MVGFSDYKYFIKVFKKYTGCSPARFIGKSWFKTNHVNKTLNGGLTSIASVRVYVDDGIDVRNGKTE